MTYPQGNTANGDHRPDFGIYFSVVLSIYVSRKLESKKKQLERLKDQLQKLEVQATDKVNYSIL